MLEIIENFKCTARYYDDYYLDFTYVYFFDEQISRKFQHIAIQYHVRITVSRDFMNIPQMSIIHWNASIIIYEQWSLQWQAN